MCSNYFVADYEVRSFLNFQTIVLTLFTSSILSLQKFFEWWPPELSQMTRQITCCYHRRGKKLVHMSYLFRGRFQASRPMCPRTSMYRTSGGSPVLWNRLGRCFAWDFTFAVYRTFYCCYWLLRLSILQWILLIILRTERLNWSNNQHVNKITHNPNLTTVNNSPGHVIQVRVGYVKGGV